MSKVLYGYFGSLIEHNEDIPGHPLYQLNLLDTLGERLNITELDVMHYNSRITSFPVVLPESRTELHRGLVSREFYPREFAEVCRNIRDRKYDFILLKHRFRNLSRLRDQHGLDVAIYEKLLVQALSKNIQVYILDTDLSIEESFFSEFKNVGIISYCLDHHPQRQDMYLIPTSEIIFSQAQESFMLKKSLSVFEFDGNNYFKDPRLAQYLKRLRGFDGILLHGKYWGKDEHRQVDGVKCFNIGALNKFISVQVFDRRVSTYFLEQTWNTARVTVNLTKPLYEKCNFVAPRIVEAFMMGIFPLVPDGYKFMHPDLRFSSYYEFEQKARFFATSGTYKMLSEYIEYMMSYKVEEYCGNSGD